MGRSNERPSRPRKASRFISCLAITRSSATKRDRKSTRLNSSHLVISYAVFCLKKKKVRRRLFRAILALPAIYRAPVVLRDIQGMSTEEASAMLRVNAQTLKASLHRGRLILRQQ